MDNLHFRLHPISIADHAHSGLLDILWSDGAFMQFKHAFLRMHCKCADCKASPATENIHHASLRLKEVRPVGSYGVQLIFNDGHDRGIYPWPYLHALGRA